MVMVNDEVVLFKLGFMVFKSNSVFLELFGRGVGKMMLRLMQGFFGSASGGTEPDDLTKKGMPGVV